MNRFACVSFCLLKIGVNYHIDFRTSMKVPTFGRVSFRLSLAPLSASSKARFLKVTRLCRGCAKAESESLVKTTTVGRGPQGGMSTKRN